MLHGKTGACPVNRGSVLPSARPGSVTGRAAVTSFRIAPATGVRQRSRRQDENVSGERGSVATGRCSRRNPYAGFPDR